MGDPPTSDREYYRAAAELTVHYGPDIRQGRQALVMDQEVWDSMALLETQVRQIMDRGVMAVELVFLFTLAAGILVMYAGIQASLEERRSEHGVLRTLGAGRAKLLRGLFP